MNRREDLVLGGPLRNSLRADGYLVVDDLFAPEEVKELVDNFTRMVRYRVVSTRRAPRAITGDMEAVHHAVMLDPVTAAVFTLPQIRSMIGELLGAQERWLPRFSLEERTAP